MQQLQQTAKLQRTLFDHKIQILIVGNVINCLCVVYLMSAAHLSLYVRLRVAYESVSEWMNKWLSEWGSNGPREYLSVWMSGCGSVGVLQWMWIRVAVTQQSNGLGQLRSLYRLSTKSWIVLTLTFFKTTTKKIVLFWTFFLLFIQKIRLIRQRISGERTELSSTVQQFER